LARKNVLQQPYSEHGQVLQRRNREDRLRAPGAKPHRVAKSGKTVHRPSVEHERRLCAPEAFRNIFNAVAEPYSGHLSGERMASLPIQPRAWHENFVIWGLTPWLPSQMSWFIYGPVTVAHRSKHASGSHPCRVVSVSYEQMLGCHGIFRKFGNGQAAEGMNSNCRELIPAPLLVVVWLGVMKLVPAIFTVRGRNCAPDLFWSRQAESKTFCSSSSPVRPPRETLAGSSSLSCRSGVGPHDSSVTGSKARARRLMCLIVRQIEGVRLRR
jgi:hypothetical protein